jgi:hypothetical protein
MKEENMTKSQQLKKSALKFANLILKVMAIDVVLLGK